MLLSCLCIDDLLEVNIPVISNHLRVCQLCAVLLRSAIRFFNSCYDRHRESSIRVRSTMANMVTVAQIGRAGLVFVAPEERQTVK